MSKTFEDFDDDICDKFLNFIYPDESTLSDKEISAELKSLGIDVSSGWDRIKMALDERKRQQSRQSVTQSRQILKGE